MGTLGGVSSFKSFYNGMCDRIRAFQATAKARPYVEVVKDGRVLTYRGFFKEEEKKAAVTAKLREKLLGMNGVTLEDQRGPFSLREREKLRGATLKENGL